MMADPNIKESEMFKDAEKFGNAMDELTAAIVQPCLDYAQEHNEDDEGWTHTVLISLARATCKLTYAFQHSGAEEQDVFRFYHEELLPLCKEIAYRESDELVELAHRKEESDSKDGVSWETKEAMIRAMADPNRTTESIVAEFFRKDMPDEKRQQAIDHIDHVRAEQADKLARIWEKMQKKED